MMSRNSFHFIRRASSTLVKVRLHENAVELQSLKDGGSSERFLNVWLRDNCQCSTCLHPTNRQKLHSSGKFGVSAVTREDGLTKFPLASVRSAKLMKDDSSLEIEWKEAGPNNPAHRSTFSLDWLVRHNYNLPKTPLIKPIVWTAKDYASKRKTIEFKDFFNTKDGYQTVLSQLRDYGLAFLRNVPTSKATIVESVAEKFGVIRNSFYGTSWDVKNDPQSKNIAYTSLFLGLHMDLLYFEAPPGLQLLHCLENDAIGGTSLFHDVFGSVEKMRRKHPKEFEVLTRVPVTFHYNNDGKYFEYHRPTINLDINDLYHVFYSPPFQGPLQSLSEKDASAFYHAFALFESLIQAPEYQYEYLMKPGDLVLFANRRVLHARDSFDPASGNRWLKGTYVEWDCIKDQIRRMG